MSKSACTQCYYAKQWANQIHLDAWLATAQPKSLPHWPSQTIPAICKASASPEQSSDPDSVIPQLMHIIDTNPCQSGMPPAICMDDTNTNPL